MILAGFGRTHPGSDRSTLTFQPVKNGAGIADRQVDYRRINSPSEAKYLAVLVHRH